MLVGGVGNDTIDAGSSGAGDTLDGGPDGDDTYIFTKGQTIVPDTKGNNTYIGIKADLDDAVTVTGNDIIGGAANFFVTGDRSNILELGTGGIITTESDKTQSLTVENATGTTKTGGGNDRLTFGNVSGVVDAGAGDDKIEVSGSVSGSVSAGLGNDSINISGTDGVVAEGVINGDEGDDSISADVVQAGGLIDGGEGADTIAVTSLFGAVKGGGLGKNVFDIATVFGGASITTGAGDEDIIVGAVGSDAAEGAGVALIGGAGKNNLGVSYGTTPTTYATGVAGSTTSAMSLVGGAGDDILQGTPFGGDTLEGGGGNDILYGGSSAISRFTTELGNGGSALANNALNFGDADSLVGGAGEDNFLFVSTDETGSVQDQLTSVTFNEEGQFDGRVVIGLGTGDGIVADVSFGEVPANGTGFFTAAFNVDTVTGFKVGEDRLVFNENAFGAVGGTEVPVQFFEGRGGLYGAIIDGENGTNYLNLAGGGTASVYDAANDAFYEGFALNIGAASANANTGTNVDFGSAGFLYDTASKGLYLGGGGAADRAVLVAVLDQPVGFADGIVTGDIANITEISLTQDGVNLF
jgi:hypothetical protein